MSERIKGVVVTFDRDIPEEDAAVIIAAFRAFRCVVSVQPSVADFSDVMNCERARHDWSKLDAGWQERGGELRWCTETSTVYPFLVSVIEKQADDYAPDRNMIDARWCDHDWDDTCRVCVTPLFEAMDRMSAEIPAEEWAKVPTYPNGLRCKSCGADRPPECPCPDGEKASDHVIRVTVDALNRWSQDANEVPVRLPPATVREVQRIATEQVRSLADSINASEPPDPRDLPVGPLVRLFGVPWKLGPLATWTLVNISNHDGRLTVVMKRGRGEVLIETGVDDEGIWERLAMKVVEVDKAKAKAAHADK